MNTKSKFFSTALVLTTALAFPAAHAATLIYSQNFLPAAGTDPLHDTAVETGSGNWVATSTYLVNGTIGGTGAGTATLAFTPVNGLVYTLDASFTNIAGDSNWIAFGFVNGQGTSAANSGANPNGENRFLEVQTSGIAWLMTRGNNDPNPNNAILGVPDLINAGSAGGNTDADPWTGGPTNGGNIDMRIVLDTTAGAGAWTATWFAKRDVDASYTTIRTASDLLSKDITSVGFGKSSDAVTATITSFSLTSIPEPSTALLGGLGLLALMRRRRA